MHVQTIVSDLLSFFSRHQNIFIKFVTLFHLLLTWVAFCHKLKEKSQHLLIFAILKLLYILASNFAKMRKRFSRKHETKFFVSTLFLTGHFQEMAHCYEKITTNHSQIDSVDYRMKTGTILAGDTMPRLIFRVCLGTERKFM